MRFYYYDNQLWCDENYFNHVYEFTAYWEWVNTKGFPRPAYLKASPIGIEILSCPVKLICKLKLRK